jgi:hypothetical protein
LEGAVWVLRFKTTRDCDHKRVEDFPTEAQAFAEAERLRLYHRARIKTWNPDLCNSCRISFARVEEGTGIEETPAGEVYRSTLNFLGCEEDRRDSFAVITNAQEV